MEKYKDKRERVLGTSKKESGFKSLYLVPIAVIAVVVVFFLAGNSGGGPTANVVNVQEVAQESGIELQTRDYAGLRVDKKIVSPIEDGDLIGVSLEDLNTYRLLYFTYSGVPVLVYIDTNGNIIMSIAECEPCKNKDRFFIQDNILVCGACFTKWKLGSHEGISGGCKEYPPFILDNQVKGENVFVKKSDLTSWTPRA